MIRIADIQRAIAAKRHISVKAIKGPRRQPKLVRTRHDAMYLARRLTGHSLATIGHHFGGRDHSTVIHGCRRVQQRIHRNEKTRKAMAALIDDISQISFGDKSHKNASHVDSTGCIEL